MAMSREEFNLTLLHDACNANTHTNTQSSALEQAIKECEEFSSLAAFFRLMSFDFSSSSVRSAMSWLG